MGKPVIATCRPNCIKTSEREALDILFRYRGDDNSKWRIFLSTEEMINALGYISRKKAEEIVVTNTNRIADMCEEIVFPQRGHKYPDYEKVHINHDYGPGCHVHHRLPHKQERRNKE